MGPHQMREGTVGFASRNQWVAIAVIGVVAFAIGVWRDLAFFTWVGIALAVLGVIGYVVVGVDKAGVDRQ